MGEEVEVGDRPSSMTETTEVEGVARSDGGEPRSTTGLADAGSFCGGQSMLGLVAARLG